MRRNAWRRTHYATDELYRQTAKESTHAWLHSQGGAAAYHRNYRKRRKERSEAQPTGGTGDVDQCAGAGQRAAATGATLGRSKPQKETDEVAASADANRDARYGQHPVMTGHYLLIPSGGAKGDAIVVQLLAIAGQTGGLQRTTYF